MSLNYSLGQEGSYYAIRDVGDQQVFSSQIFADALDAAFTLSGSFYLKPKSTPYPLEHRTTMKNNIALWSDGHPTIRMNDLVNDIMVDLNGNISNMTMKGVKFDQNRLGQRRERLQYFGGGVDPYDGVSSVLDGYPVWVGIFGRYNIGDKINFLVEDCDFLNYTCFALDCDDWNFSTVKWSRFSGGGVTGVRAHAVNDFWILENTTTVDTPAKIVDKGHYQAIQMDGRRIECIGNTIYVRNFVNYDIYQTQGIQLDSDAPYLTEDITVMKNKVIGLGDSQAAGIIGNDLSTTAVRNKIVDNYLENLRHGIFIPGNNTLVDLNRLLNIKSYALTFNPMSAGSKVYRNDEKNCGYGAFMYNAQNIDVQRNVLEGIYGAVVEEGTSDYNTYRDNRRMVGTYSLVGANNSVLDNQPPIITYRSTPGPVEATLDGAPIYSDWRRAVIPGYPLTFQFQKRVVI